MNEPEFNPDEERRESKFRKPLILFICLLLVIVMIISLIAPLM